MEGAALTLHNRDCGAGGNLMMCAPNTWQTGTGMDGGGVSGMHWLAPMLAPRSVALVGASGRADTVGAAMLEVLEGGGFGGAIWPVNPRYETIGARACHGSLADLPGAPDLAVLSVASVRMEESLRAAIDHGARSVVIFDPCMMEGDGEPRLLERLKAMAREAGLPVCGGNGMGFYNYAASTFVSFQGPLQTKAGAIALFCHSGSVFVLLANGDARFRFNLVTSQGQEINGSVADYMDYALAQPETRVLALFVETVRDPERFVAALEKARGQGVPVVICKVGRTEASAALARSHSGAIAGSDAAFQAICERHGALLVRDLDALMAAAQLLAAAPPAGPGALSVVLDSGGLREGLIDLAEEAGVPLTTLTPGTVERLKGFLPPILEPVNPLDAAGPLNEAFGAVIAQGIDALAADPGTAALFVELAFDDRFVYMPSLLDKVKGLPGETDLPVAFVSSFATVTNARIADEFADAGVPVINGARNALVAARALFAARQARETRDDPPPAGPDGNALAFWRERLAGGAPLDEVEGLALVAAFGVPTTAATVVENREEAIAAAERFGGAVALKSAAPGLDHKSDADGVRLGLAGGIAVAAAYDDIAGRLGPRVTVAAMAEPGTELAFGMVRDPQFGPLVVVAAGGVLIEVLQDRLLAVPPFGPATARALLGRLKAARLLAGVRGRPAADMEAAAAALAAFSVLADALGRDTVAEIDLNPVICGPDGALAVDALVVPG